MSLLNFPSAPNLPLSPLDFDSRYQEGLNNVLRLYFNRLSGTLQSVLGPDGGQYINSPFGSFISTVDQIAVSTTTAYEVTLSSTTASNGVTLVSGSRVTFGYSGHYNIQFSIQLSNNSNATQDIDIWFRKNGTDIANSNSRFGLAPRKSAGDPYHVIGSLNFIDSFQAGDYVQLIWRTSHVDAYLEYYAAGTTPTRPAIPSVILTATFVSSVSE
jgi:hypothetical protein